MVRLTATTLQDLYEQDETAWLEMMSSLAAADRVADMDLRNLSEYLSDMAKRDRREVLSRLSLLLAHLLNWRYQPQMRGSSWRTTIEVQRQELLSLLESGTLHNHAIDVFAKAYQNGIRLASAETSLPETAFPEDCPMTLDQALSERLDEQSLAAEE